MTPCEKFQSSLAAEAFEADPEFVAHLAVCSDCQAEAESFRSLALNLQNLAAADPGELFFAAQRKRILKTLSEERPSHRRVPWRSALALAAAVVLLFIGFSQWQGRHESSVSPWSTAMLEVVQGQGSVTGSGILELESLSPQQLESLAHNMERRILSNQRDELLEESPDLYDLSGPELEQLVQRLKVGENA